MQSAGKFSDTSEVENRHRRNRTSVKQVTLQNRQGITLVALQLFWLCRGKWEKSLNTSNYKGKEKRFANLLRSLIEA
jgi:hypothetical protein